MNPLRLLFLAFLIIPILEIYFLTEMGGLIGAFPTALLVVVSAVVGAHLLKTQGFATWTRLQNTLREGKIPAYELIEGPIILIGGALLLTPGFITDALGLLCLIPASRRKIAELLMRHAWAQTGIDPIKPTASPGETLEGEFERQSDKNPTSGKP